MKSKTEEKYYLDLFKKYFRGFPQGEIKPCERPDFLIINDNKTIGIELTKIYQQNSRNLPFPAKDSIANDIVLRIKSLLEKNNHNVYEVHLNLSIDRNLTIKERDLIAKKIFRLVKQRILTSNIPCEIDNDFEDLEKFPEEVSRISVYKLPNLLSPFVSDAKAGWMQYDMIDLLQETINRKSDKVNQYFSCKQLWLLIHTVSMSSGAFFNPSEETLNHYYSSCFDRVFYLNSFDKKVYELKLITISKK
jgi:hypothetical protein